MGAEGVNAVGCSQVWYAAMNDGTGEVKRPSYRIQLSVAVVRPARGDGQCSVCCVRRHAGFETAQFGAYPVRQPVSGRTGTNRQWAIPNIGIIILTCHKRRQLWLVSVT